MIQPQFIDEFIAWARGTFGEGDHTASLLAHVKEELAEVEERPGALEEYIDIIILGMDGAWRAGREKEIIPRFSAASLRDKSTLATIRKNIPHVWRDFIEYYVESGEGKWIEIIHFGLLGAMLQGYTLEEIEKELYRKHHINIQRTWIIPSDNTKPIKHQG